MQVPRPGTDVVLATRDRSGSPLLVCAEHGAGRVAWLGSDELWRWRTHGDGSVHAAMWLRQVMEGEDFASPVAELEGAKRAYVSTDMPLDGNYHFAPKN